MKLKCKIVGGKKVLVIPAIYEDMFEEGKRYNGMLCSRIARYKVLIIPAIISDQYEEGKEYDFMPV